VSSEVSHKVREMLQVHWWLKSDGTYVGEPIRHPQVDDLGGGGQDLPCACIACSLPCKRCPRKAMLCGRYQDNKHNSL
jgi:hypothetical protein